MSVLESNRTIEADVLKRYLPEDTPEQLPVLNSASGGNGDFISDRDLLYKMIFQLKQEIAQLKERVDMASQGGTKIGDATYLNPAPAVVSNNPKRTQVAEEAVYTPVEGEERHTEEPLQQTLSIPSVNAELIKKCLEKHNGRRREAAAELGISERTLYRKIKELNLNI